MSSRNLVILVMTLLLVGGGLAIWNAERKTPETKSPLAQTETLGGGSEVVGRNVSFMVTEGEVKKWKLEAKSAIYNDNRTEAQLREVKGEFYNAEGKPILRFRAPKGEYKNDNNQVVLSGGVVAESTTEKGGRLLAPKMSWDAKSKEVTATGGIEMIFPQGKSTARTSRFALDFSKVSLEGDVSSVIAH